MADKKIYSLIVLLVIVFTLIGFLLITKYDVSNSIDNTDAEKDNVSNRNVLKNIYEEKEVPDNKNVVTDRLTTEIDKEGLLVVIKDGSAYSVERGVVLVDNTLIKRNDEGVVVDYINSSPRRIITS